MSSIAKNVASSSPRRSVLDLQAQLSASAYREVRQLSCELSGGRVVVRGTVHSYYMKQVAESLASKLVGAGSVESDIEVQAE